MSAALREGADVGRDVITDVHWQSNNLLSFIGTGKNLEHHLFTLSTSGKFLKQITYRMAQDVSWYSDAKSLRGRARVCTAGPPPVSDAALYGAADPKLPDVEIGTGLSFFEPSISQVYYRHYSA